MWKGKRDWWVLAAQTLDRLFMALDVWEPEKGFRVVNDNWGVPNGSTLLWPHMECILLNTCNNHR